MGSLFKSKSTTVTDPGAKAAWNIAKPTFEFANTQGRNVVQDVLNNPAYAGDRVADLNPFQTGTADLAGNFVQNNANQGAQLLTNVGLNNLGNLNTFGANASNLFSRFSGDPTAQIIDNAALYANNPYVNGLIDASSRDVVRQLSEGTLPTLNRQFSGTGNTNSTRAGVESAIATRGAADRLADLSSNIRSQFFGQGLNMSQNQYNQNLSNLLNANNQLYNSGASGINALGASTDYLGNMFNIGQGAGGLYQNQGQNELDANKAMFDESLANRLGSLQTLSGIGANTQAKTSAGVTQNPSLAQQVGGLALGAGSLIKAFSDIRMKQNVVFLETTPAGNNIYEYEYKPEFKDIAGHGRFRGVMAQEIEKTIPEAVSIASNGYKMVDYSKVR